VNLPTSLTILPIGLDDHKFRGALPTKHRADDYQAESPWERSPHSLDVQPTACPLCHWQSSEYSVPVNRRSANPWWRDDGISIGLRPAPLMFLRSQPDSRPVYQAATNLQTKAPQGLEATSPYF